MVGYCWEPQAGYRHLPRASHRQLMCPTCSLLLGMVQAVAAWPTAVEEPLQAELTTWPTGRMTSLVERVQTMVGLRCWASRCWLVVVPF